MKEADQKILESALDVVINKFSDQHFIAQDFENYSKMLRNKHFQNQNLHKRKRKCLIIGCNEQAIKRSHSIPKSSILKNIAVNGHVLKPEFNGGGKFPKNEMVAIGINNASVFTGYCVKHEDIFKDFEVDGKFDNSKKALLQTYRTICRERIYREVELEINKVIEKEYRQKINQEAKECLKDLLTGYPQFNDVFNDISEVEIKGVDKVINSLNHLNSHLFQPIEQFKIFEENIFKEILNLPYKNSLIVRIVSVDFHLPISVCGFGYQSYIENEEEKNACVLMNIMPQKSSTYIICVGLEQDKKLVENFFKFSFSNPFNILNMVESFIINGSDHWFVNPDYWNNFSLLKQEKILYDILFTEDSFIDEYKFSIFDDVRNKIINVIRNGINSREEAITNFEEKIINKELMKLKNTNYDMSKDENVLFEKLNKILFSK